jgi:ketosteroid isomerase-like protein
MVSGREDLIEHVKPIPGIQIEKLVLTPVEIYGIGDLAYEVGTQSLSIEPALEGFGSSRKYLHVMRKTEKGWRFSALMSSDN